MADFGTNRLLDASSQATFSDVETRRLFHSTETMVEKLALRPMTPRQVMEKVDKSNESCLHARSPELLRLGSAARRNWSIAYLYSRPLREAGHQANTDQ